MEIPKILSVYPQKDKNLLVKFTNGVEKTYNCKKILQLDAFELLTNEAFFKAVKVDAGGYGVSWNDDLDLSEYELWTKGVEVEETPRPEIDYRNPIEGVAENDWAAVG